MMIWRLKARIGICGPRGTKVFAKLAPLELVSGVGIADSKLAVYLTRLLKERETQHIRKVAASAAGGREVKFLRRNASRSSDATRSLYLGWHGVGTLMARMSRRGGLAIAS